MPTKGEGGSSPRRAGDLCVQSRHRGSVAKRGGGGGGAFDAGVLGGRTRGGGWASPDRIPFRSGTKGGGACPSSLKEGKERIVVSSSSGYLRKEGGRNENNRIGEERRGLHLFLKKACQEKGGEREDLPFIAVRRGKDNLTRNTSGKKRLLFHGRKEFARRRWGMEAHPFQF